MGVVRLRCRVARHPCDRCWTVAAKRGRTVRFEVDVCDPAKESCQLTLDLNIRPLQDGEGQIIRLLLEARDITERKQVEREVERKTEERRVLYEQRPDQLIILVNKLSHAFFPSRFEHAPNLAR